MSLSPSQEAVLMEIVTELPAGADWYIFGGVDSVLRGVEANLSDVNVLTAEATAETSKRMSRASV